jgi:hypothetical protein
MGRNPSRTGVVLIFCGPDKCTFLSFAAPRTKLDLNPLVAPTSIPRSKTHHHPTTTNCRVSPTPIHTPPVPTIPDDARAPNSTIHEQRTKAAGQRAPPTSDTTTTTTESTSPEVTSYPLRPESPLAHARRGAGSDAPPAQIETFSTLYRLSIVLPRPGGAPLAPEMITVSARRGARLAVVADAWHLEHDC